ncbi:agrin-like [Lytechinus variegatus]|uniref:agrin-like n=1 Tax=Lytechinus variegatus TaxID=7654 RepID=UPI001BB160D5|nr:agrin-like [Lytechinus variegatus]
MGTISFHVCLFLGLFVICFPLCLCVDDNSSKSNEAQVRIQQCQTCRRSQLNPVCGNDGKTYLSFCHLQRAACMMKKTLERTNLRLSRWGACSTMTTQLKDAGNGNGGRSPRTTRMPTQRVTMKSTTHPHSTHAHPTNTLTTTYPPSTIHSQTSPMTRSKKVCFVCYPVRVTAPVCASNGVTYDSMCQLLRVACLTERATGKRGPSYINTGQCAPPRRRT